MHFRYYNLLKMQQVGKYLLCQNYDICIFDWQ